jgi:hypothetical protein
MAIPTLMLGVIRVVQIGDIDATITSGSNDLSVFARMVKAADLANTIRNRDR